MSLSQNDMGRAFEYSIAMGFCRYLPATIVDNVQMRKATQCFNDCPQSERARMVQAASEAVAFLTAHDDRLSENSCMVKLQSDQAGMRGDVRDIIIHNNVLNQDIGVSAKHHHWAVKHSRLSQRIDFGSEWFHIRCSDSYFHQVTPIFAELETRRRHGQDWKDIPDKMQRYYMPILAAFRTELTSLFQSHQSEVAGGLVHYLLGNYDFYKVIKEDGEVSINSFNVNHTLRWGSRIRLPSRIVEISQKPTSQTTLIITFDEGWQISFRIHNASTKVEPSLKFDINLIGSPTTMTRHVIAYG
jgi:hypothetical protein